MLIVVNHKAKVCHFTLKNFNKIFYYSTEQIGIIFYTLIKFNNRIVPHVFYIIKDNIIIFVKKIKKVCLILPYKYSDIDREVCQK